MTPAVLPDHPHIRNRSWFPVEVLGRGPGEATFAMIKPDAQDKVEAILDLIQDEGLVVLTWEQRTLTPMDVRALYWQHIGRFYYDRNAEFIQSGPCLLLALAGDNAVERWRTKLMPKIRARWGLHNGDADKLHVNQVHGSDCNENAFRELHYFFG